jgi:hypothetical protein
MRGWMWGSGLLIMGLMMGCNDDLYAPCEFSEKDPQAAACGAEGAEYSCAIENSLQCDTRVCARYEGGDAFCTKQCASDGDCGAQGTCRELVFQSGKKFCVETSKTQ